MGQRYISERTVKNFLLLVDLAFLLLAVSLVYHFRIGIPVDSFSWLEPFPVYVLAVVGCLYLLGSYSWVRYRYRVRETITTLVAVVFAGLLITLYLFAFRIPVEGLFGRIVLVGSLGLFALMATIYRWWFLGYLRQRSKRVRWLVVGEGEYLKPFMQDVKRLGHGEQYYFLLDDPNSLPQAGKRVIGHLSEIKKVASTMRWSGVVVALKDDNVRTYARDILDLQLPKDCIMHIRDYYEYVWSQIPVQYVDQGWLLFARGFQLINNPIGLRIKRIYDTIGALLLLLITSPIMLLTYLLIKLESPGPAIYSQVRVGEAGQPFTIYKFRSMRTDAETNGAQWAQQNDDRVTKVGKIIRKMRIDELPQLVNVVMGSMSFIGPRPERPEFIQELEKQIPYYGLRHLLRPGVTGWAQVSYPYGASVEDAEEKLKYDLYYIKNYSLILDISILVRTFRVVLGQRGR